MLQSKNKLVLKRFLGNWGKNAVIYSSFSGKSFAIDNLPFGKVYPIFVIHSPLSKLHVCFIEAYVPYSDSVFTEPTQQLENKITKPHYQIMQYGNV